MSEMSTEALHMASALRVGRRVGRTIYAQLGPEPSDVDPLVATADSPVLAERIVRAVNAAAPVAREDSPEASSPAHELLRTGRRVGRTIYVQHGLDPADDDPLIGVMDSEALASRVVDAVNGAALHTVQELNEARKQGRAEVAPAQPAVAPGTQSAAPTRDALVAAFSDAEVTGDFFADDTVSWHKPEEAEAERMADVALGVLRGGRADGGGEDEAKAALRELVTLKDGDRGDEYERRKPLAWSRARRVLGIPEETTVPVDPEADYDANAGSCPGCGHEIDLREVCHVCRRVPSVRGEPAPDLPWSMTRPMDFADDDEELDGPEPRCGAFHPEYGFTCRDLPKGHGRWHWDRAGGYWDTHGQHIDGIAEVDFARLAVAAGLPTGSDVDTVEAAIRTGREPEVVTHQLAVASSGDFAVVTACCEERLNNLSRPFRLTVTRERCSCAPAPAPAPLAVGEVVQRENAARLDELPVGSIVESPGGSLAKRWNDDEPWRIPGSLFPVGVVRVGAGGGES